MNYIELTNEYNKFMNNSGIRKFCQEKCIPHCCNHPTCTFKTCNQSLGCISFICYLLIPKIFSDKDGETWTSMHRKILEKIRPINESQNFTDNSLLRHYSPGMDAIEFNDEDFELLFKLNKENFKISEYIKPITFIF